MSKTVSEAVSKSRAAVENEPQKDAMQLPEPATDGGSAGGSGGAAPSLPPATVAPDPSEVEAFGGLLQLLGDAAVGLGRITNSPRLAFLKWPGWSMSEKELLNLATAVVRCRMRYFPTVNMGEDSELLRLLAALVMPLAIRMGEYGRWKADQDAKTAGDSTEVKPASGAV